MPRVCGRSGIAGIPWAVALLAACIASSASGQVRVVSYNVAQLQGDLASLGDVFEALVDDDQPGYATAPHVLVMQEVRSNQTGTLLTLLNDAAPPGVTYALGTFTSIGNEDNFGGAQAMFYRTDTFIEQTSLHVDIFTGAGRYADRWKLQMVDYASADAGFFIYSMHLRAGSGAANEADRFFGVDQVRDDADSLPGGSRIIYAGDLNFSSSSEDGYERLTEPGPTAAIDPYGDGSWSGSGNAIKHTQSPRADAGGGLIGGGLDDRFDFQLSTFLLHDGAGLDYISGSIRALGNDGQHYNVAINLGSNFYYPGELARSNALADDLHDGSDHLPLICEYQVPAILGVDIPADFGRVIQNGAATVTLTITNDAPAVTPIGADTLNYTAAGAVGLSGFGVGAIPAATPGVEIPFTIDTSAVGPLDGSIIILLDNEAAPEGLIPATSSGEIIRAAAPSWSGAKVVTEATVDVAAGPDTGILSVPVPIHNVGFDAAQALLDVDDVMVDAGPLSAATTMIAGVGADPVDLEFLLDTDGLAPGMYEIDATIFTSDEDLPGEGVSALTLTFAISISGDPEPIAGDLDGDGDVDPADLAALLAAWGSDDMNADLDGDGVVGPADLATLLANWG